MITGIVYATTLSMGIARVHVWFSLSFNIDLPTDHASNAPSGWQWTSFILPGDFNHFLCLALAYCMRLKLVRLTLHRPGAVRVMESATIYWRGVFGKVRSKAPAELVLHSLAMIRWNDKDSLLHHEHRSAPPAASDGQEYLNGADMNVAAVHLIRKTNAMKDHPEVSVPKWATYGVGWQCYLTAKSEGNGAGCMILCMISRKGR